mgnify:CR=1 FL=1
MTFRLRGDTRFSGVLVGVNIEKLEIEGNKLKLNYDILDMAGYTVQEDDMDLAQEIAQVLFTIIENYQTCDNEETKL